MSKSSATRGRLGHAGWPLVLAGSLKIAYDLMLLYTCRNIRPPEEA